MLLVRRSSIHCSARRLHDGQWAVGQTGAAVRAVSATFRSATPVVHARSVVPCRSRGSHQRSRRGQWSSQMRSRRSQWRCRSGWWLQRRERPRRHRRPRLWIFRPSCCAVLACPKMRNSWRKMQRRSASKRPCLRQACAWTNAQRLWSVTKNVVQTPKRRWLQPSQTGTQQQKSSKGRKLSLRGSQPSLASSRQRM